MSVDVMQLLNRYERAVRSLPENEREQAARAYYDALTCEEREALRKAFQTACATTRAFIEALKPAVEEAVARIVALWSNYLELKEDGE